MLSSPPSEDAQPKRLQRSIPKETVSACSRSQHPLPPARGPQAAASRSQSAARLLTALSRGCPRLGPLTCPAPASCPRRVLGAAPPAQPGAGSASGGSRRPAPRRSSRRRRASPQRRSAHAPSCWARSASSSRGRHPAALGARWPLLQSPPAVPASRSPGIQHHSHPRPQARWRLRRHAAPANHRPACSGPAPHPLLCRASQSAPGSRMSPPHFPPPPRGAALPSLG